MTNEQGQTVAVGSSDSSAWVRTADRLPPNKVEVETKLDDSTLGVRNVQTLKRSGNLWFFPDMSMYVYYHPTHWRSLPNAEMRDAANGDRSGGTGSRRSSPSSG